MKRSITNWRLRTRSVELGRRTLIMGIVNITPDSFSDGGLYFTADKAIAQALQLLDDGADLLDLGAESTRPGARAGGVDAAVSAGEELDRLLPVLEGILKERPSALLSVDTYKTETARAALASGAEIVNDVSGFTWDSGLAPVCGQSGAGVILTHSRGKPEDWRSQERLPALELVRTVREGLTASVEAAHRAGVSPQSIVLDPGYGFGKRLDDNFVLMVRQSDFLNLGYPLAAGVSRKAFIGNALSKLFEGEPAPIEARESGSLAAATAAILFGASLIRVHHVRLAREAAAVADSLVAAMENG